MFEDNSNSVYISAGDLEEGKEPESAEGFRVPEPRPDPGQDSGDAGQLRTLRNSVFQPRKSWWLVYAPSIKLVACLRF